MATLDERQFLRLAQALTAIPNITEPTYAPPRGATYTAVGATGQQIADADAAIAAFDWDDAQALASFEETQHLAVIGASMARRLGNPQSTSSNVLQDVPGLAFHLAAGRHYAFRFVGAYTAAAGATGIALAVNGPAAAAVFGVAAQIHESGTAVRGGATGSYNTPLTSQNSGGANPLPWWIEGTITTTAAGVLVLRFASEVNGSQVTLTRGTFGRVDVAKE